MLSVVASISLSDVCFCFGPSAAAPPLLSRRLVTTSLQLPPQPQHHGLSNVTPTRNRTCAEICNTRTLDHSLYDPWSANFCAGLSSTFDMSQAKSLGGRKLKLPTAYCPDRMRHRDNFRDFYQRMRIADQRLGLDYSTGNKRMMIDLWLSRLSPDLLRQVSHATKKQFEFETIYHLYEMCCCIQFHDQVEVMRRNLVNHRFVDRHPEWADFEAFLATNEKELGYDRIEDRGELLEKKAFDLCLARFTRKRLEKLRLLTNELENITTETELLKVLREIDWSKEPPYTLTKYWRDVKAKEEAENFLESFLPTIKSEPEGTVVKKEKSESEER
ncbi:hypothetical protein HDK90DRAFT_500348, partial [Phyllosticta capitalensis]